MKYAIDRYEMGLEKEVSADIFYNKYIPRKKGRFFCPECGEPVFWSSRGGSQPDKFSHYNKTEQTPECDKRVDGRSELNLYERVGLPVYLTIRDVNQFSLMIGFPAVGEKSLAIAASQNIKVCIAGAEHYRKVSVNAVNFLEDGITLVPINFIPYPGKNFGVTIEPVEALELRKKWSDYADGFGYGGAIFTYEETGGKKIRKGGNVSSDKQYYVIARQFDPPQEISSQRLGTIILSKNVYNVYLITINISVEDANRYRYVKDYMQRQFGVWLLQTSPELIPLWPPMAEQGRMIPVKSNVKMYCSVSSGNDEPNVYRYDGSEVFPLAVDKTEGDSHTVSFSIHCQEIFLSVDRKYAGREIAFQSKKVIHPKYEYNFYIEKGNGDLVEWKDITKDVISEPFFLNSNAKMEVYIGTRDKIFQHISVREQRVAVPAQYNSEEIMFVEEDGVFIHYRTKAANRGKSLKETLTVDKIRKCCKGELVPVPYWIEYIFLKWKGIGNNRILNEVKRMIVNGKIPAGILKILYECYSAEEYHI